MLKTVREYTFFGKTKRVICYIHNPTAEIEYPVPLWVERGEDWYALIAIDRQYKDKGLAKVYIVRREDWIETPTIEGNF